MRIPRLYVPTPIAGAARVSLPDGAARHAVKVLRLRHGDALVVFDGTGGEHAAHLDSGAGGSASAVLERFVDVDRESSLTIHLGQGVSRGERMDLVVQKAVEAGVSAITPIECERSVVRLSGERAARRHAHWTAIAVHACEQSGRTRVPALAPIARLEAWFDTIPTDAVKLTLSPDAPRALRDVGHHGMPVAFLIGPEGGLERGEIAAASAAGFEPVRMGPRTLRTETAALAAIVTAQALWGDLG